MAELLAEVHEMRMEMKGMHDDVNNRIGRLENEQPKRTSELVNSGYRF